MKILAVTENEWEDLKKVRLSSLKDSPEAFGLSYAEAKNYTSQNWKDTASGYKELRFFIAYEGDLPIGLIGGVYLNNKYELVSMWVSPNFRGSEVGGELIASLKKYALKQGHRSIVLKVSSENKRACHFYKKCGFSITLMDGIIVTNESVILQEMIWAENAQPNKTSE